MGMISTMRKWIYSQRIKLSQRLILGVSILALLTAPVEAAILQLERIASVDTGYGYVPATKNMQLNPGDRVRVSGGCVRVFYDSGSLSKLCDGQMGIAVSEVPQQQQPAPACSLKDGPCPASASQDDLLGAAVMAAAGIGIGVGISASTSPSVSP
jgi:hypothetical protein